MSRPASPSRGFTGLHMLAVMFAFFGVIIAVNITMAVFANTSWTGFVVRNSYVAGLEFNDKTQAAREQAALKWTSSVAIADGRITFTVHDADGKQMALSEGTASLRRPVSDAEDTLVTLSPDAKGGLSADIRLRDGSWIIETNAIAADATPWHEATRVLLREGKTK